MAADIITLRPTKKLSPCPFCGDRDELETDDDGGSNVDVFVRCHGCGAQGPATRVGCRDDDDGEIDLESEAIELWNQRTPSVNADSAEEK